MGLFSRNNNQDQDQAVTRYKAAKKALRANQEDEIRKGIDHETPKFHRLNHEFREAERDVPWWRR